MGKAQNIICFLSKTANIFNGINEGLLPEHAHKKSGQSGNK